MTALLSKASPADSITSLADVAAERTQKTDVQTDGHGTHHCASCSKPAFNCCAACRNAPTDDLGKLGSTWYCGVGCQSEDWVHHKSTCKGLMARKILYRAGKTIQALFYVYRKVAFDKLIIRVEREGNSLILYEGEYLGQHEQCFIPFPATLLPDENEKLAVLTYLACGDAYMYMDVILKTMLEGKYFSEERTLQATLS